MEAKAETALLALLLRGWLRWYVSIERKIRGHMQTSVLPKVRAIEARAHEVYLASLAQASDAAGEISGSVRHARAAEKKLERLFKSRLSGEVNRVGQGKMRELSAAAGEHFASSTRTWSALAGVLGQASMARAYERAAERSSAAAESLSGMSAWAMRRDLEQLGERTGHRAALSLAGNLDGGRMDVARVDAGSAVKVNARSVQNSVAGTTRMAVRAKVYALGTKSGVVSRWGALSPFPGGRFRGSIDVEESWIRKASKAARGEGWKAGNPISGFGFHPGSRTMWAPVFSVEDFAAIAAALYLIWPNLDGELAVSRSPASFEDESPAVIFRGAELQDEGGFVDLVKREIRKLRQRGPRRRVEEEISGQILMVFDEEPHTSLMVLNKGTAEGLLRGARIMLANKEGAPKGEAAVTAAYQSTSVAFMVFGDARLSPAVGDAFTSL